MSHRAEQVELRWLRPDGKKAMAVVKRYATAEEAVAAVGACLTALKEVRRAGTGSRLDAGHQKVEP